MIEFIKYDARFNQAAAAGRIELEYPVEIFGMVDYQPPVDRLTTL